MASSDKHGTPIDHEEELLLPSDGGLEGSTHYLKPGGPSEDRHTTERWKRGLFQSSVVVNIVFLFVNLWLFIELAKRLSKPSIHDPILYSPAQEAVAFENRPVDGLAEESIYAGYPSPVSDAAWNALIEGINLKIFPEEMSKLDQTSLEMKDGTGYLATLGVYHELHCIKRLRRWFYRDYYYPNATELEYNERMTHAEHCLEFIRQAAVCHGDITITSFKWLHDAAGHVIEPTTKEGALHRCVRWDRLSDWAKSRRVDLFDPNLLRPEGN
ncbi:hypothetical protein F4824DRAFT_391668 [Ustulina deusta]|nr:hypothetical protein F4823DRAFT_553699 [Ustulina deusta]KAI3328679.1 hypothetical protein F4824DRAFT_391668 [Ustulina deusta]